jgi:hypothetical protein
MVVISVLRTRVRNLTHEICPLQQSANLIFDLIDPEFVDLLPALCVDVKGQQGRFVDAIF